MLRQSASTLPAEPTEPDTGVTAELVRRVWQHKHGQGSAFTRRFRLTSWSDGGAHRMDEAIAREKQMQARSKARRRGMIDAFNPEWRDLYFDLA